MKSRVLVAALLMLGACKRSDAPARPDLAPAVDELLRQSEAHEVPHGSMRTSGTYVVGLYHVEAPGSSLEASLTRRLAGTAIQRAKDRGALEALRTRGVAGVLVEARTLAELPAQSAEDLRDFGRGLEPKDLERLARAVAVSYVELAFPRPTAYPLVRQAELLIGQLAEDTGAYVFDALTNETFSAKSWQATRTTAWNGSSPIAIGHVGVRVSMEQGRTSAVSLGMAKLGLPAISVRDVEEPRLERIDAVLRALLQALVDRGALDEEGQLALDGDRAPLSWTRPRPGDREALELTLAPRAYLRLRDQPLMRRSSAAPAPK